MNHPRTDALHQRLMTPTVKADEYAAMKQHAEKLEEELVAEKYARMANAAETERLREELAVARAMR